MFYFCFTVVEVERGRFTQSVSFVKIVFVFAYVSTVLCRENIISATLSFSALCLILPVCSSVSICLFVCLLSVSLHKITVIKEGQCFRAVCLIIAYAICLCNYLYNPEKIKQGNRYGNNPFNDILFRISVYFYERSCQITGLVFPLYLKWSLVGDSISQYILQMYF